MFQSGTRLVTSRVTNQVDEYVEFSNLDLILDMSTIACWSLPVEIQKPYFKSCWVRAMHEVYGKTPGNLVLSWERARA